MRKSDSRIAITVILIFGVLLIALGLIAFTPRTKKFTYITEARAYQDNNVYMTGEDHKYHYCAYASHFHCYIDCDEALEEVDDSPAVELTVRPIGLRWYRTDNSGIWTRELTVVYQLTE